MRRAEGPLAPVLRFDEVAAALGMGDVEVARLLLAGTLRFRVDKRSPGRNAVLAVDVWVAAEDVRALLAARFDPEARLEADRLVNRAALKFGVHPTRRSPGVRGKGRRAGVA